MTARSNALRFILNDDDIELTELKATETLLDYLRLTKRLRGSKEGCAEGDCGACTVLVGRMSGDELVYETVNACICFVGMLHGTHVVTIEHLSPANGPLHPVQQAMVDFHGSQCGFCTPGIVMSLYGLWMAEPNPSVPQIEKALQGNLCRCTGYTPIVKAGLAMSSYANVEADPLVAHREAMKARIAALNDGVTIDIGEGKNRIIIPGSVDELIREELSPKAGNTPGAGFILQPRADAPDRRIGRRRPHSNAHLPGRTEPRWGRVGDCCRRRTRDDRAARVP